MTTLSQDKKVDYCGCPMSPTGLYGTLTFPDGDPKETMLTLVCSLTTFDKTVMVVEPLPAEMTLEGVAGQIEEILQPKLNDAGWGARVAPISSHRWRVETFPLKPDEVECICAMDWDVNLITVPRIRRSRG